jgi:hypothetical protein
MPGKDGTGPYGNDRIHSRGKTWHCTGFRYDGIGRTMFRRRGGWIWGICAPVAAAVVRDILNPAGLLRQFMRLVPHDRSRETDRTIRDAEYEVLENSKSVQNIDSKEIEKWKKSS